MAQENITKSLQCMEIVGGNRVVRQAIRAPGLRIWVECRPHQSETGGDIHYLSMCGSGRVTRLAIADVAGHGEDAAELAAWLRGLMRKHINLLDQRRFAVQINQSLTERQQRGGQFRFATVALMTYFAPTDHLIICNAGHPPPLWYSHRIGRWALLEPGMSDTGPPLSRETARYLGRSVANLPLGVLEGTTYVQFAVKLAPGDFVVAYTDGLLEARNSAGKMLGRDGMLRLAEAVGTGSDPQSLAQRLLQEVEAYRGTPDGDDDLTVVVLQHTAEDPPPMSLGGLVRLLPRLLGLTRA